MTPPMPNTVSAPQGQPNRRHDDEWIDRVLSGDPEVANAFDANQMRQPCFVRAAEWLKGKGYHESEAIAALRKDWGALAVNQVPIFVSYKAAQAANVREIVRALESGSSKIEIKCADRIQPGMPWRDYIATETGKANWLILLYMDPAADWGWCLYECGGFDTAMRHGDRLVCLHPPGDKPPDQLSHFQAIAVEPNSLDRFLEELLTKPDAVPGLEPLNPNADIAAIRDRIIKAFADINRPRDVRRFYFDYFLEFSLEDASRLVDPAKLSAADRESLGLVDVEVADERERKALQEQNLGTILEHNLAILKDAEIKDIDDVSLEIFDWAYKPATFGELVSHVIPRHADKRWLQELAVAARNVATGRRAYKPIYATFKPPSGKVYRVILHAIDRFVSDGVERYHLLFTEDVASAAGPVLADKGFAALAELLKMTYRMRTEVLKPCVEEPVSEARIKTAVEALRRIEAEAQSLGFVDPELVLEVLDDDDRGPAQKLFERWMKVRSPDLSRYSGDLDLAIDHEDYDKVREILVGFWPTNKEFMVILSRTFAKKVEELEA